MNFRDLTWIIPQDGVHLKTEPKPNHMKFKSFLRLTQGLLLSIAALTFVNACDSTETSYIELDKTDSDIGSEGGTITVNVNATGTYVATCPESWVTVTNDIDNCTITVAANTTASSRTATVTVTCGNTSQTIKINQSGKSSSSTSNPWDDKIETVETVLIKAGTFLMGLSDETQHPVTLTKDFYMGKYEVTYAQFCAFLNENSIGSDREFATADYGTQTLFLPNSYYVEYSDGNWMLRSGYENYPVEWVTWYGANEYAKWIGGALPTEAQWEYACRAGSTTAYCFDDDSESLDDYAWYSDNSDGTEVNSRNRPVGQKKPNAWGLYDMHGNVWEWCADWYGSYGTSAVTDPTGPTTGSVRVLRGGSWQAVASECSSANRNYNYPGKEWDAYGFRVCFPSSNTETPYIELDKSSETIDAGGGTITIKVNASSSFVATCTKSWVTIAGGTGSCGIAVAANVTTEERTATVTFNCGGATKTFTVTQSGSTAKYWHDKMEKVRIKAGTFAMGSPTRETGHYDNETQHQVTLTKDFYMGKYEVTNAQFCAFLNENSIGSDGEFATADYGAQTLVYTHSWGVKYSNGNWIPQSGYENYPVVWVTWYGANEYAKWIGGALPTEAQWEYTCRAGSTTAYCFGDSSDDLGDYAWYYINSHSKTHPVGQKKPNAWGLNDMHGNVFEWCSDWYSSSYGTIAVTDPTGPTTGTYRVSRGGSWFNDNAHWSRSAKRGYSKPDICYENFGFRVCFPSSNTETPYFELDKSSETIGAGGGSITINVNASGSFTATCPESWVTIASDTGCCTITVAANTATAERAATVTFTCGDSVKTFSVTQIGSTAKYWHDKMEKVLIKARTFTMGSPPRETGRYDDETQHQVTLTKDFYMGKYEVTNAQFCKFLNNYGIGRDGKFATADYGTQTLISTNERGVEGVKYSGGKWIPNGGVNHPVVFVTWYGANEYAKWIGGALPTEAQWEYACRAGSTTAFFFGDDSDRINEYAWYFYSDDYAAPRSVGQKKPNAWGLYDMYGNVCEWCADWYGDYPTSAVTDPTGPMTGTSRVLRGGSCDSNAYNCRSATRYANYPANYNGLSGFRVCFPVE